MSSVSTPNNAYTPPAVAGRPSLSPQAKAWRFRVFASTWICYAGYYFCRKPFSVAKSRIGHDLSMDAEQLAWIGAVYLIAYTIGQFASGALGPRFGPRRMLLGGMLVSVLSGFGFAASSSLSAFLILSAINGFGQATGWSNTVGTMAAWTYRSERGTIMGIWSTCFQVGNVAAPALTAWVLQGWGFRAAFVAGSVVLALVAVLVFLFQANRPEDKGLPPIADPALPPVGPSNTPVADVRWSRSTWTTVLLIGGAYFGMKFIRYALDSWAPFFLSRRFGLHDDQAGYVSTLFGLCGIVGVVFTGWLSDKIFSGRRAGVAFAMILGVVAATVGIVTLGTGSVTAFAVSIGLIGFTLYGPDALLTGAGAMDIGGESGAVRAAGIISGLGSAGSVVQELLIGKLYQKSPDDIRPVLATLLGFAIFSAFCIGAMVIRNSRGVSDV